MIINTEQANEQYKTTINSLVSKYGTSTAIPRDEWNEASETLRLHLTVAKYGGKVTTHILSQYMFPPFIIAKINPEFEGVEPKVKRADKYDAVYKWLDENAGSVITTQDFEAITQMSYPTTLKFIENNPQYFRKIKRGQYEVRSPKAEREADK